MLQLNAQTMEAIESKKLERAQQLSSLIAHSFDVSNEVQQKKFKSYLDSFELKSNILFIVYGLYSKFSYNIATLVLSLFLPVPYVCFFLMSNVSVSSVLAKLVINEYMNQFNLELNDMKRIYEWCLEKKSIDNLLKHSDIQRLMKLIAPFCDNKFMIRWNTIQEQKNQTGFLSTVYNFFSRPETHTDIDAFKHKIENRGFDLNWYSALRNAFQFFSHDHDLKTWLSSCFPDAFKTLEITHSSLYQH